MIFSDEQRKQIEKKVTIRNCEKCNGHLLFDVETATFNENSEKYKKDLLVITCSNCGLVQFRDIKYILPDWR